MTHEELLEEQYLLEKAAKTAVAKVLQDGDNKIFVQVSHLLADEPNNNWKITIEKVIE